MFKIPFDRESLDESQSDFRQWPEVDPYDLSEPNMNRYYLRRKAIELYLSGGSLSTIFEESSISKSELYRLIKRCLTFHPDGQIYGFRALVPYGRQKQYSRIKNVDTQSQGNKGGFAGALNLLFESHPELKELVDNLFFNKKLSGKIVIERRARYRTIHKKFITACRRLGLNGNDYPLNTEGMGYRALANYLNQLHKKEPKKSAARDGGDVAKKLGSGQDSNPYRPNRPLERVEIDGHKVDALWVFDVPHPYLESTTLTLSRVWILALIDSFSRAILGYSLCLEREYNQYDVLRCIKNSIEPWQKLNLTMPGLEYAQGAGFPSGIIPAYAWSVWDALIYDNALANIAKSVRGVLYGNLGCDVNSGPVYTKDHQPFIESFFKTLEESIFHRLPNTTGFGPKDGRRKDPEKAALRYHMDLAHFKQLTDVFISGYNATPHSSLGGATPLEVLDRYAATKGCMIRTVPMEKRNSLWLLNQAVTKTVRGDMRKGRRPYVEFYYAHYDSQILRNSPCLIGKKIKIFFDPTSDDIRTVNAYLDNGNELGVLNAKGPWSRSPHSLEVRIAVHRMKQKKYLHYLENDDPVQVYLDFLSNEALVSKKARNKMAAIQYKTNRAIEENESEQENIPEKNDQRPDTILSINQLNINPPGNGYLDF